MQRTGKILSCLSQIKSGGRQCMSWLIGLLARILAEFAGRTYKVLASSQVRKHTSLRTQCYRAVTTRICQS
ncbi:hypothetical protein BJX63DRAFT_393292 [Aspergillus granulosus]|uniref:Uncharacterized protein n=1 Tax=Aspergillus granulosus TaxID=176169 RepID=A0ABR4HGU8_9EURO